MCANRQRARDMYRCLFCSHAHFLPVASLSHTHRWLIHKTIFHMCTKERAANIPVQADKRRHTPLHTPLTFPTLYSFILFSFFFHFSYVRQSQRIVLMIMKTCTGYLYYKIDIQNIQYDMDLKCGAAVCIFFSLFVFMVFRCVRCGCCCFLFAFIVAIVVPQSNDIRSFKNCVIGSCMELADANQNLKWTKFYQTHKIHYKQKCIKNAFAFLFPAIPNLFSCSFAYYFLLYFSHYILIKTWNKRREEKKRKRFQHNNTRNHCKNWRL